MAKNKQAKAEGAPEWMVTYGDMMSLLLCFFVLLAAFSELKTEKVQQALESLRDAFGGYIQGTGRIPSDSLPTTSVVPRLDEVRLHDKQFREISKADDPGVYGKETTVRKIREGWIFTVGGWITFEPGSVALKPQAREQLAKLAERIRGKNNKIEIRGHSVGSDQRATEMDLWDLSSARAKAVMRFLTAGPQGIQPDRIRIVGCGDAEPLKERVYDETKAAVNRRVEVIVTESLVQEFQADTGDRALSAVTDQVDSHGE